MKPNSPWKFKEGDRVRHYADDDNTTLGVVQGYFPDGCVKVLMPSGTIIPVMEGLLEKVNKRG